jgi:SAM-dependent methyltransferase/3-polyprenyl-4-hydroxybenzoate decarboxylase
VPRDRDEVLLHLEQLSGAPLESTAAIDELLDLLCAAQVFQRDAPAPRPAGPVTRATRLLLGLTGAVASIHAPALVQLLQKAGFEVRVAMTRAARRFVSPLGLESLTHAPVPSDLWSHAQGGAVPHINLAEWAELMLICPASATTLCRLAQGDCSDLVSATAIATRAQVVVVPSMNPAMLTAKAVVRNLSRIAEDGFYVVHSGHGFEVADSPTERAVGHGGTPRLSSVVAMVRFIAGLKVRDWEEIYANLPLHSLPWFTDSIEPEVEAALARFVPAAVRMLDIGTGPGTFAIEMARRGHRVVALDISASAVRAAQARAAEDAVRITWHIGDFLASDIGGPFTVLYDRGCFHSLARQSLPGYCDRVASLLAPGGLFFLLTFAADYPHPTEALAFTLPEIADLFAPRFQVVHSQDVLLKGQPRHRGLFAVLSRTGR